MPSITPDTIFCKELRTSGNEKPRWKPVRHSAGLVLLFRPNRPANRWIRWMASFLWESGGTQGSRTPVLNLLHADIKHAYAQIGRRLSRLHHSVYSALSSVFCPVCSWRGAGASPTVFCSVRKRETREGRVAAEADNVVAIWIRGRLFTRPTGQPRHAISGKLDQVETGSVPFSSGDSPYVRKVTTP